MSVPVTERFDPEPLLESESPYVRRWAERMMEELEQRVDRGGDR